MDILRFITAGSVDDGKSTLIGRLLYDSKSIMIDQLEAIEKNKKNDDGTVDLALLTDGLRAEREQGITIDIAYKYFNTPKRKFIIADAPGHIQYTRNMVTGASNSSLAIILIDARNGVAEQTCRHSFIASLLGLPHLVVCVNKMDLVGFSEEVFNKIHDDFRKFAAKLNIKDVQFIPISALNGDNIVDKSQNMPWYKGRCLLDHLEEVHVESDENLIDARFPVQYVIRPQTTEYHDYRGYAGKITSGIFKKGEEVVVLPSGFKSKIKSIDVFEGELEEAFAPMSVTINLEDDIDISRGDMIVKADNQPIVSQDIEAHICWMDNRTLNVGDKYLLQHNSRKVKCIIKEIPYKINVNTLEKIENVDAIGLNDICKVVLRTASPICYDDYQKNRANGAFILINENTNTTVGACMIMKAVI